MTECEVCQGTGLEEFKVMAVEVKGLPVVGYKPTQSQANIDLVDEGKLLEERVLRYIDKVNCGLPGEGDDRRFLATGRTDIQKGFMMVFRSIFNPGRTPLPEDEVRGTFPTE